VYNTFAHEKGVVEAVVSAGSVTQIPFFVPKGRAILWRVMVKYLDIQFGVKLRVQEMGGAVEVSSRHCTDGHTSSSVSCIICLSSAVESYFVT
jgi:hypothetical protein